MSREKVQILSLHLDENALLAIPAFRIDEKHIAAEFNCYFPFLEYQIYQEHS